MDKSPAFVKTFALTLVGFLAVFVGIGAILVVFDAATWEQVQDWAFKALLVVTILVVVSVIIGAIMGMLRKDDQE